MTYLCCGLWVFFFKICLFSCTDKVCDLISLSFVIFKLLFFFFNLSRVFIAVIMSGDNHLGSAGFSTLFLRSVACFSITGRKASYQATNAVDGSETPRTLAKGAELKSLRKSSWLKCLKERYWTVVWPFASFLGSLHDYVQMTRQSSLIQISETWTLETICSLFV